MPFICGFAQTVVQDLVLKNHGNKCQENKWHEHYCQGCANGKNSRQGGIHEPKWEKFVVVYVNWLLFEEHSINVEGAGGNHVDQVYPGENEEEQKGVVVVDAHAIVDPLTVMIVSLNTLIAEWTVNCSVWFEYLTVRADESLMEIFIELQKGDLNRFLYKARIPRGRESKHEHLEEKERHNWPVKDLLLRKRKHKDAH